MLSTNHARSKTRSKPRSLAAFAVLTGFTALLGCSCVMAQPKSGEGPPDGRNGPPVEALNACQSAKSGDSCSFSSPHGAVSGTCMAPQGRPLACVPAQGHAGKSSTPPRP